MTALHMLLFSGYRAGQRGIHIPYYYYPVGLFLLDHLFKSDHSIAHLLSMVPYENVMPEPFDLPPRPKAGQSSSSGE